MFRTLSKLRNFYTKIFNLEILEEDPGIWVLLKAGEACIGLHRAGTAYRVKHGSAGSNNNTKIVFEITTDISAMRENLLTSGVPMRPVKTFDDYAYWLCDGEDPEGNVFQLKQKKDGC